MVDPFQDQKASRDMTIESSIERLIEKGKEYLAVQRFDSLNFQNRAQRLLEIAVEAENDLIAGQITSCHYACGRAAAFLVEHDYPVGAEQLLIWFWNRLAQRQVDIKTRIYRASVAYNLTQLKIRQSDLGAATRWALLTQADDVLGGHEQGGAGRQFLRSVLGIGDRELEALNEAAQQSRTEIDLNGWSKRQSFAEDVLVCVAERQPHMVQLFGQEANVTQYPLCPAYFRLLLEQVTSDKNGPASTTEVGNRLEHLAAYLFLLIPGWMPTTKVIPADESAEHDLVVSNLNRSGNLLAELFGRNFLVECKNWKAKVGVSQVGYFLYRMRLTHCRFGVIFAKEGITGNTDEAKAARALIRRAYHEDHSICVVLDKHDLENLVGTQYEFWNLLIQRASEIRFGSPSTSRSNQ